MSYRKEDTVFACFKKVNLKCAMYKLKKETYEQEEYARITWANPG